MRVDGQAMDSGTYEIRERLHQGRSTTVYRAVRGADRRQVILKVSNAVPSSEEPLGRLQRELTSARELAGLSPGPPSLSSFEGRPALEFEDRGLLPLRNLVGSSLGVEELLELFLALARAVEGIHARGFLHKNLTPEHLLYDPVTREIRVSGLGLARRAARELSVTRAARLIEGSLPYVSPEQTGRLNRAIDSRSDLYSLGVVLYELLTGRLPFTAADPMGWVHAHVARKPAAITLATSSVPSMVPAIVLKLLEKVPDARYQSASGLAHDLERCLSSFREAGMVGPFPLGERDVSDRFLFPQSLYGRERERAGLLEAFERVAASGRPELVLVAGYSGIGKTSVVRELERPVVARRGLFISGKFDRYKREVPYATLAEAFRELVLDILTEPEERVAELRERLSAALGPNGALLLELIPELLSLVGPQPAVPKLPPSEAENRLRRLLRQFFGVFATAERPLTLFLDDLQWVDPASLGLLVDLVSDEEQRHLLLVGAYRDNEVDRLHPLRRAIDGLLQAGAPVREIVLGPLSESELGQLVADTVHATREESASLSALVNEKTRGNPFFVLELLTTLRREGEIEFDRAAGRWRWDIARIRARGYSDNVAELLAQKVGRLPPETREALALCACLRGTFTRARLTALFGDEHRAALERALEENLLVQVDDGYRFSHDRVEEAAYALVPAERRAETHLAIGRKLLASTPPDALEEACFDLVHQLNGGAPLITEREERAEVAELDLMAGRRALRAAAHASALGYLAAGSSLLDDSAWEERHDLAFSLELNRAECEFLTGELDRAEARLSTLEQRAVGLVEAAAITCVRVALFTTRDRIDQAVESCLSYLRRLRVDWSPHPSDEDVQREYDAIWSRLGERSIEDLIDLAPGMDPEYRATMDVLKAFEPPALFSDDNLRCLLVGRMVNLSLEHGTSDGSCLAYGWLGTVLGSRFGDFDAGFRFGKLGIDLLEKRGQQAFKAPLYLAFGHRITPWSRHLAGGLPLLRRAFTAAQESGDLTFASYVCNCSLTLLLAKGTPLAEVQREAEDSLAFVHRAKFGLVVDIILGQLRVIQALLGLPPGYPSLAASDFDEAAFERRLAGDPRLAIAACWYWVRKLQSRCILGDHHAALEAAAKAEPLLWTSASFFEIAEFHFYRALALAARCDPGAPDAAWYLGELERHRARLIEWHRNCPDNFTDRVRLVDAEIARLRGEHERAATLYEEAIRAARENGFVQNEAMAYERAARFYGDRGFECFAETYLGEARTRYLRWGAAVKVQELERFLPAASERWSADEHPALRPEHLDLLAVAKASQTISGELVEERLVATLLEVVLEQGGARRARLILLRGDEPAVTADVRVDEAGVSREEQRVPESVLNYAQRTGEVVLLDDASADAGRFAADPYFAERRSRSVLCMPVRRQAALIGLMYLENDLVPGAFTPERLLTLSLLAAQAAISLENAHLLARELAARQRAEADRRRAVLLEEVTAIIAKAPDLEDVSGVLTTLCTAGFADWAMVDLAEGGRNARLVSSHADPAKNLLLRELAERYPARLGTTSPVVAVLQRGEPVSIPSLPSRDLRNYCVDDRHAEILRELGLGSLISAPIMARGAQLGALTLVSATPDRFEPPDVELTIELGRRIATAIDNARLAALENSLRQSQKMEAVGRLAGGVAHDFNNLLCVILTYAELIGGSLREDDPLRAEVEEIRRAGVRASELTRQLLAFGRQQVLKPRSVDLNQIVSGMEKMLKRLLGPTVELTVVADPALGTTLADPGQIEQVLMNLVVNAHDAMPRGGQLTVETKNVAVDDAQAREHTGVAPGRYVSLSVTDTGSGMDRKTLERIFEPFYTTKAQGKGTGLGLATVFGIVKQSGGHINVESRPGVGTTFEVYLPASELGPATAAAPLTRAEARHGSETILVVEVEDQVRAAVGAILRRSGYDVLEAPGAGEALLVSEQHPGTIHLLLSAVELPRMSGPELAERIRARHPELQSLFMSDYSEPLRPELVKPTLSHVLEKPIMPSTLSAKVREALEDYPGSRPTG